MIGKNLIKKSVSKGNRTKLVILAGVVLAVATIADPVAAARMYVCTAGANPVCFLMPA